MSKISVKNLTFSYDTNYQNIFENVSFEIDSDWKLGFVGRNGKGKTTFLNLLLGNYDYKGNILTNKNFSYFPFIVDESKNTNEIIRNTIAPFDKWDSEMQQCIEQNTEQSLKIYGDLLDKYTYNDGYIIDDLIEKEIRKLNVSVDVLDRKFNILSNGEKTKVLLASLFLRKNSFLLIDEPTNHLDFEGRKIVADYLRTKKGFILVSHDRYFLDNIVDHIISINKSNIEIQKGNYSSYNYNFELRNNFEMNENEKKKKEIKHLEDKAKNARRWSTRLENTKIGAGVTDKRNNRGWLSAQATRTMKKALNFEKRIEKVIDQKKSLLKNIERVDKLKIHQIDYFKNCFVRAENLSIQYDDNILFNDINFEINKGDRISVNGKNGSGKTSLIKLILGKQLTYSGKINVGSNLIISYVNQDTSHIKGSFKEYIESKSIEKPLFRAILAKLNFDEVLFDKKMEELSMGQKKKIIIARSLCEKAHLYIWDEPLNYIDIISRKQIENLILEYEPTLLFVEHDILFKNNISTKEINL